MSASPDNEPPCECSTAGFCPRYGIEQSEHHVELCHTNAAYRAKWRKVAVTNRVPLPVAPPRPVKPPAPWPWFARTLARARRDGEKGLGDTVARVFARFGAGAMKRVYTRLTGRDCGCGNRQDKLNKRFSYT